MDKQAACMGPEALLLSARLAEQRSLRVYGDLEMPAESSMYVELCVRAQLKGAVVADAPAGHSGAWARLRALLRRAAKGNGPGDARDPRGPDPWLPVVAAPERGEPASSISAAPIRAPQAVGRLSAGGGTNLPLALQPFLQADP